MEGLKELGRNEKKGKIRYLQSLMEFRILKNEHDLRVCGFWLLFKKTGIKSIIRLILMDSRLAMLLVLLNREEWISQANMNLFCFHQ